MAKVSRAMVQTGARTLQMREFPLPVLSEDDGLLKVEACGLCITDVSQYQGDYNAWMQYPVVPGHEPVGIIDRIGPVAAKRWGVKEGDRVAVEAPLPCHSCKQCRRGNYNLCTRYERLSCYAWIPIETPPSPLWGAYADYMYLDPHSIVHRAGSRVPAELLALFDAVAAGVHWAVQWQQTPGGDTIVIIGCGQRGLSCVVAGKESGAARIIVVGLRREADQLAVARELGADYTIVADERDVLVEVKRLSGGTGADVVVDTTPLAAMSLARAIEMVARGGTVALAGPKKPSRASDLCSDVIMEKGIRVLGSTGVPWQANEAALRIIESGRHRLDKMHSHTVPLERAEYALQLLADEIPGESALHIAITP